MDENVKNPENYVALDVETPAEGATPEVAEVPAVEPELEEAAPATDPASESTEEVVEAPEATESDEEAEKVEEEKAEEAEVVGDETNSEDEVEEEVEEDKYALLEQQFNELNEKCSSLEKLNEELLAFKKQVEDREKDELIAKFYMLSDEDKKSVIENKSNYTLDEIEKELSVICVRKRVSFEKEDSSDDQKPYIYNVDHVESEELPAWLQAVEQTRNRK